MNVQDDVVAVREGALHLAVGVREFIAQELQETRTSGAIEVRPIREALFHGA